MDKRTYLSYKSEMFAHTAAKRRIANVAVLWAHQIKSDKGVENRIFDTATSKMRRAHFFLSFLTFFHFSHLLQ